MPTLSTDPKLREIARSLYQAERDNQPIDQISSNHPGLTIDDAYAIQLINYEQALRDGKKVTGKKIGLTSLAMQQSLKVDQPDFGFLYDSMEVAADGIIPENAVMQPRVEGELAFVLKESLGGQVTPQQVLDATEYVVPAIEIVGSRIRDWKLTIVDTVADNASCGMYRLSRQRINPREVDLKQIKLTLSQNGREINSGYGSAVLGDPASSVAWLAHCLGRYGITLDKGDVVLSGALSAAVPASPGDVFTCDFAVHGSLRVQFT